MPADPNKPSSRTLLWLLLGASAGAGGLLYLRRRRIRARQAADSPPANASVPVPTPRPGDILLFHNARGMNKLITWFTGSPFYHAALYAGDGHTVEARTPGVVRQDLRGRENDFVVAPAPESKGAAALAWGGNAGRRRLRQPGCGRHHPGSSVPLSALQLHAPRQILLRRVCCRRLRQSGRAPVPPERSGRRGSRRLCPFCTRRGTAKSALKKLILAMRRRSCRWEC